MCLRENKFYSTSNLCHAAWHVSSHCRIVRLPCHVSAAPATGEEIKGRQLSLDSVLVSSLCCWDTNTWHAQPKKGKVYFGSQLQRLQSVVSWSEGLVKGSCSSHAARKGQREQGLGAGHNLQRSASEDPLFQPTPLLTLHPAMKLSAASSMLRLVSPKANCLPKCLHLNTWKLQGDILGTYKLNSRS